jgi:hypothetical protein
MGLGPDGVNAMQCVNTKNRPTTKNMLAGLETPAEEPRSYHLVSSGDPASLRGHAPQNP